MKAPEYIKVRGQVYRLAAQPQFSPSKVQHPTGGPTLTRDHFVAISQLSKEDFDEVAEAILDHMVQLCTVQYSNAENWCVAVNGEQLGFFRDQKTARDAAKHWLFLQSLRPDAKVKLGEAVARMGSAQTKDDILGMLSNVGDTYLTARMQTAVQSLPDNYPGALAAVGALMNSLEDLAGFVESLLSSDISPDNITESDLRLLARDIEIFVDKQRATFLSPG